MGWDDNKGLKSLCSHRASDGCLGPLYFGENSLCLHLFISRSNSIGEVEGHSDCYFVSRTLATSSSVTGAAGTNPGIRCCSKMTCCWFGPNFRLVGGGGGSALIFVRTQFLNMSWP